jgi:hypothetical protein
MALILMPMPLNSARLKAKSHIQRQARLLFRLLRIRNRNVGLFPLNKSLYDVVEALTLSRGAKVAGRRSD